MGNRNDIIARLPCKNCLRGDLNSEELKTALSKYEGAHSHEDAYFNESYVLENKDGSRTHVLVKEKIGVSELPNQLALMN